MNKFPIVLSPSQQTNNPCSLGDTESNHMIPILSLAYEEMKTDPQLDVYLIPKLTGTDDDKLIQIAILSDKFINGRKPGLHVAGHSDGGYNSHGASAFWYKDGGLGQQVGLAIYKRLVALTPWSDGRAYARSELYELRKPFTSCALIETSFHDQLNEARFIHGSKVEIAECFVLGIYDVLVRYGITRPVKLIVSQEELLVDSMYADGLITTKPYWLEVLKGTVSANPEFLKTVFRTATMKIM